MQKALEEKKVTPLNAEVECIPTTTVSLPEDRAQDVLKLVGKLEQDEDVQKVFHNLSVGGVNTGVPRHVIVALKPGDPIVTCPETVAAKTESVKDSILSKDCNFS